MTTQAAPAFTHLTGHTPALISQSFPHPAQPAPTQIIQPWLSQTVPQTSQTVTGLPYPIYTPASLHTQNTLPTVTNQIPTYVPSTLANVPIPPAVPAQPPQPVDPLDQSFDADIEPPPPPSRSADYRRMLEWIVSAFPEARGPPLPERITKSVFESLFPGAPDSSSPIPSLNLFERVDQACKDAEARLVKHIDSSKWDRSLLPKRKSIYCASNFSEESPFLVRNSTLEDHLTKKVNLGRSVSLSLGDCQALEATFRGQVETLSHSMWVLSGLLALIRKEGFLPNDQALFQTLISSLSMGLAHQANMASSGITFATLKRRQLYTSHMPEHYSKSLRKELLKAPSCTGISLFRPEDLVRLAASNQESSSLRHQNALVRIVSSFVRSRSPRSSPSRPGSSRSRSPVRSPKRVRFSGTPPPSSNRSSSRSPSNSPKNFHK